jgi:membrane protease YdiL (CAAX protease family)
MMQYSVTLLASATIIVVVGSLILYNFLVRKGAIEKILSKSGIADEAVAFFFDRISGMIIFGFLPALIIIPGIGSDPSELGLTTGRTGQYHILMAVSIVIILTVTFFVSGNKNGRTRIGRHITGEINTRNIILVSAGWIIYLLGYELMFRGILWFTCYHAFGFVPAMLINIIIYSLAHINQGPTTTFGAIPMGIIFCSFSFITGSFILAFLAHSTMAVSFELFSAYRASELTPDSNYKQPEK